MRDSSWRACAAGARSNRENAGKRGSGGQEPRGRRPEGNQSVWGRGGRETGPESHPRDAEADLAGRAAAESDGRELTG